MSKDGQMYGHRALADPTLGGRDEQDETLERRKAAAEVIFLGITHIEGLHVTRMIYDLLANEQ